MMLDVEPIGAWEEHERYAGHPTTGNMAGSYVWNPDDHPRAFEWFIDVYEHQDGCLQLSVKSGNPESGVWERHSEKRKDYAHAELRLISMMNEWTPPNEEILRKVKADV